MYMQIGGLKQRIMMNGRRYLDQKYLLRWNLPGFSAIATITFFLTNKYYIPTRRKKKSVSAPEKLLVFLTMSSRLNRYIYDKIGCT